TGPRTGPRRRRRPCSRGRRGAAMRTGGASSWRYSLRCRAAGSSCSSLGHHVGLQHHDRAVAVAGGVVAAREDPVHGLLDHAAAATAVLGGAGTGTQAKFVVAVAQAQVLDVVLRRAGGLVGAAEVVGGVEPAVGGQAGAGAGGAAAEGGGGHAAALALLDAVAAAARRVVAALDPDHPAVAVGQDRVADLVLGLAQGRLGLLEGKAAVEHVGAHALFQQGAA